MKEYSNTEMQAMLMDLGLTYSQELNRAMAKKDKEKAMKFIELQDCVDKLMEDIEKR